MTPSRGKECVHLSLSVVLMETLPSSSSKVKGGGKAATLSKKNQEVKDIPSPHGDGVTTVPVPTQMGIRESGCKNGPSCGG